MKLLIVAAVVLCVSQCQAEDNRKFLNWFVPYSLPPREPLPTQFPNVNHKTLNDRSVYNATELPIFLMNVLQNIQKLCDQYGWTELSMYIDYWIDVLNQYLQYQNFIGGHYKQSRDGIIEGGCKLLDIRPECMLST